MFGNSFTQDSMSYVPFILKSIAPSLKVTLGIAYKGAAPLAQHYANFTGQTITIDSNEYSPSNYTLYRYKEGAESWDGGVSLNAIDCLNAESWDIVTFQQAGGTAMKEWDTYYAPYIYKLHKEIFDHASKPVKLGWLSIHAAYANSIDSARTYWQQIVENSKKVSELTCNQIVFPFGTAVQNLATIPSLADIGDSVGMTADGGHLHEGLPCLVAAYANALILLREAGIEGKSIVGESTRPTKEWCSAIGVPGTNYGEITNDVVGITEDNCYLAQVAAIQAVKKPYEISDLASFVA